MGVGSGEGSIKGKGESERVREEIHGGEIEREEINIDNPSLPKTILNLHLISLSPV